MDAQFTAAGLIGTAPSKELLDIWNTRERALVEDGPEKVPPAGLFWQGVACPSYRPCHATQATATPTLQLPQKACACSRE
jgi:hypothetical protein